MPVDLLKKIADQCPSNVRLLGLDVGKKTIGLAVCDPDHNVATPLSTIKRTKFTRDVEVLCKVIEEYEIGGYVIGLPVNMDGSEGKSAQSVRDFALELHKQLQELSSHPPTLSRPPTSSRQRPGSTSSKAQDPVLQRDDNKGGDANPPDPWIALWDERLSTVSVEDYVDNLVDKRKTRVESKSSGLIDKLAAQVILQGALEFMVP